MTTTKETRQFRMSPQLLMDVIKRQAGSLSKGILEAVMNSVDAKASKCTIMLASHLVVIEDDGQGFRSRKEIEDWFEVFGQPHAENEQKTYGTFRMGRGQMFAFGANSWRSGKFAMEVDIDQKGLDYELHNVAESQSGCRIEIRLYTKLMPSEVAEVERDLEVWCRFCQIPVELNGSDLATDPAMEKWDHVTEDAYIRLRDTGTLAVYNLGVHVADLPHHRYGTGGVVVSRKQLKVNFARNDIQADCKVWKGVKKLVDQFATTKMTKKPVLNDGERQRLADKLLRGELTLDDVDEISLVTAVTGRSYTLDQVMRPHDYPQVTVAPRGDRKGEKIMRSKLAFVVATETLERFHVKTLEDLRKKLLPLVPEHQVLFHRWLTQRSFVAFNELSPGLTDDCEVLEEKELNPREQLWLGLLGKGIHRLMSRESICAQARQGIRQRQIRIGVSETSDGWTDGETYMCVSRKFLEELELDIKGLTSVGVLLLHLLCHHSPDLKSHDHDQTFFEEFHEQATQIGEFVSFTMSCVPQFCETLKRRMTKEMLRSQDHVAGAESALTNCSAVTQRNGKHLVEEKQ